MQIGHQLVLALKRLLNFLQSGKHGAGQRFANLEALLKALPPQADTLHEVLSHTLLEGSCACPAHLCIGVYVARS